MRKNICDIWVKKSTQFRQVHSLVNKTNQYNYQKKKVKFRVGNVKTVHVLTFLWAWMFLIHDHVQVNLCSGQVLWPLASLCSSKVNFRSLASEISAENTALFSATTIITITCTVANFQFKSPTVVWSLLSSLTWKRGSMASSSVVLAGTAGTPWH